MCFNKMGVYSVENRFKNHFYDVSLIVLLAKLRASVSEKKRDVYIINNRHDFNENI